MIDYRTEAIHRYRRKVYWQAAGITLLFIILRIISLRYGYASGLYATLPPQSWHTIFHNWPILLFNGVLCYVGFFFIGRMTKKWNEGEEEGRPPT